MVLPDRLNPLGRVWCIYAVKKNFHCMLKVTHIINIICITRLTGNGGSLSIDCPEGHYIS